MKQVFLAQHPTDAYLVQGMLESHGIAAKVQGEALFSARGETPVTPDTLPSVWVLDDDQAGEALELLRTRQAAEPGDTTGESWRCPACGETIESQFTACWNCGAERP